MNPPGEIVLQIDPTDGNPRNSEGAFITLADGRIMFVYTRFSGGYADHATSDLAVVYSSDGGRTWTESEILIENRGAVNTMSVSLLRLHDGRIMFVYVTKDGVYGLPEGDCRPWVMFSDDEAATWSEPKRIIDVPGYYVLNNDRIVQLSADHPAAPGRIIAPLALHRYQAIDPERGAIMTHRGVVIWRISDDGGETWREADDWWGLPVRSGSGLQEPGVVGLADGTLFGWARTDTGYQWGTTSRDGGTTWEPFEPLYDFVSPCSPMSIKRIPSTGDMLALWNDVSGRWKLGTPAKETNGRTPLTAGLSSDNGATWTGHRLVESSAEQGYCYTAMHFVGTGSDEPAVLLAYCAGGSDTFRVLDRLRMRRVPVRWFYEV